MDTKTIANTVEKQFTSTRSAAPTLPPMLIAVGAPQREGLSTQISVGNIVSALEKHGIPTDAAGDGSENKIVAVVIAVVEEIYRAMHEDANMQMSLLPGAVSVITTGANEGGPMIAQGTNLNFVSGSGVIQ